MIKYLLLLFTLPAFSSLIIEKFPVAIKFDRAKYKFTRPKTYGTRGLILLLKDKTGYQNFSLASAGFVSSKEKFKSECKKTHLSYKEMGGTMSKLTIDIKSKEPTCSFQRVNAASLDIVEITYDLENLRAYIFSGMLLNRNSKSEKEYKQTFKKLAGGITYNIESKR